MGKNQKNPDGYAEIEINNEGQIAFSLAMSSKYAALSLEQSLLEMEKQGASIRVAEVGSQRTARFGTTTVALTPGVPAMALVQDSIRDNTNRLEHAIKCLKRKGLYSSTYDGLKKICVEKNLHHANAAVWLLICSLNGIRTPAANPEEGSEELPQKAWEIGIEMAMFTCETDRFSSDDLYGPILEPHIAEIYVYTILASCVFCVNERVDEIDKQLDSIGGYSVLHLALKGLGLLNDPPEQTGDGGQQEPELDPETADTLKKKEEEWTEERADLQRKLEQAEKDVKPLQAKIQNLQNQNVDLESWIDARDARIQELEAALDAKDRTISELSAHLLDEGLPELPDRDIVFIGGHINMVNKLRLVHPGWRIIEGHDYNFSEFTADPLCVFFWDKHMAHPGWLRAKNIIGPNVPVIYLKSTNLELLEQEMRRGYAAAIREKDNVAGE